MNQKKVIIKIHEDGGIEIIGKDEGIAIILLTPDGAEVELKSGEVKAYGHKDEDKDDLPPSVQKRMEP